MLHLLGDRPPRPIPAERQQELAAWARREFPPDRYPDLYDADEMTPEPEAPRAVTDYTAEHLVGCIRELGHQVRSNERNAGRLEFAPRYADPDDPATRWEPLTDDLEADLFYQIEQRWRIVTTRGPRPAKWPLERRRQMLLVLQHRHPTDPVLHYLQWCAKRHPDPPRLLNDLLATCFDVADDQDSELVAWFSAVVLLRVAERAVDPGADQHEIPVLLGPQGCGKSAFYRALVPPEHCRLWWTDSLRLEADQGRLIEAGLGRAIVEAGDFTTPTRKDLERLKGWITSPQDTYRLAYHHHPTTIPRRYALVLTGNSKSSVPNDPSGNRRFVPLVVTGGNRATAERYLNEHREQLWAEAWHRIADGEQPRLPDHLTAPAAAAAERHRDRDAEAEDRLDEYASQATRTTTDGRTLLCAGDLEKIARENGVTRRSRYWADLLTANGYTPTGRVRDNQGRQFRGWIPPCDA